MRTFFIFNNLRVDKFRLDDQPFPGFELLTWEDHTKTFGTLWDMGTDAGYTPIGKSFVAGQLWIANDLNQVNELEYFLGAKSGLTEPCKVKVHVETKEVCEEVEAITYRLKKIDTIYKIVDDGYWLIKRSM